MRSPTHNHMSAFLTPASWQAPSTTGQWCLQPFSYTWDSKRGLRYYLLEHRGILLVRFFCTVVRMEEDKKGRKRALHT